MRIRDVFSTPRDLRGYSRILMDTIQNPSFVSTIVKQIIKHNIEIAKEAVRIGADIIASGDDYADNSGLIMSPQTFRELLLPSFRELVAKVKEDGSFFIKHTDGNIMAIIEDLIDSGIDCIDPIDPLAGMNIEEIKKKYGRKVAIKGNIDCVNTLCRHPIKDVKMEVIRCILMAAPAGGYIISSSNTIHSGVIPENYLAMLETIYEFGNYPIDVDRIQNYI